MEERRNQLRGWTKDRLLVFDRNADRAVGYVSNMSVEGLMVMCEEPPGVFTEIECRIALPTRCCNQDQLLFDAEVRWREDSNIPGVARIGMKFTQIDDVARRIVVKLLENCTVAAASSQDVRGLSSR